MFEHVVRFLHQKDKSILSKFAYGGNSENDLANYVNNSEDGLRSAMKIDENIFIEKNTSTIMKISILRRLFALYDADPMDLVFYLRDDESEKEAKASRYEIRKKYWTYALPIIQKQHIHQGSFANAKPTISNTLSGFFGMSGFCISCVANYDQARIDFILGNSDPTVNKKAFDILYSHKAEIEEKLGIALKWGRADEHKVSWLYYALNGVSITNEADWPRMAKFHAEWSDKICDAVLPYIQEDDAARLHDVAGYCREWTFDNPNVNEHLDKCNRSYTRFTTDAMSKILPDLEGIASGWNTDNHYFYEIINKNGNKVYIQLAINSKGIPDDFRAICDRINEFYPVRSNKEEWNYRIPFSTKSVELPETLDRTTIYEKLNECLEEILAFEADLKEKLEG